MSEDRPKRPGTMTDDERALIGRSRRVQTPPHGVAIAEFDDDFTPVGVVMARIEEAMSLDERDRMLVHLFWQHTANMELRGRRRLDETEAGKLRHDLDETRTAITDIRGQHGNNGKLGELRRRVDALTKWARSIIMVALGGLGAAAIKLVIVTRTFDAVEARARHNEQQIHILQTQVATLQAALIARRFRPLIEPGKESSP